MFIQFLFTEGRLALVHGQRSWLMCMSPVNAHDFGSHATRSRPTLSDTHETATYLNIKCVLNPYGNACASSLDVSLDYVQWTSCEGERVTIGAAVLCWRGMNGRAYHPFVTHCVGKIELTLSMRVAFSAHALAGSISTHKVAIWQGTLR